MVDRITTPMVSLDAKDQTRRNLASPAAAAQEFEALLIGQLLRSARGVGGGGWLGTGEDQASQSMVDYGEEHFAKLLAAHGGLGLARTVVAALETKSGPAQTATTSKE